MRSAVFLLYAFFSILTEISAQKVFFGFVDKDTIGYDPADVLSPEAIAKRVQRGLAVYQYSDIPVTQSYVDQVSSVLDSITAISRWMNGVVGYTQDLEALRDLPFVREVRLLAQPDFNLCGSSVRNTVRSEIQTRQLERMGVQYFDSANVNGAGVTIAVFDAGFPNVNTSPWFAHLRDNGQIIGTYDFVKKRDNVYGGNIHGTGVLSCIAGKKGDERLGMATGAKFLLARTERASIEPFSEEENWLMAAEWADQHGADIISSSLGYTYHRYFQEEMDGQTSLVSEAARWAVRKGILVVNAAGNEGDSEWHYVVTPADVDSVLSVGGIDPYTGYQIAFSSFGPNMKAQRKPNVVAFGKAVVEWKKGTRTMPGTSFATPLVAGFAACVKQMNPEMTNMELFEALEKSSDLYPYYDYAHGHGVPQAKFFTDTVRAEAQPTFTLDTLRHQIVVYIPDSLVQPVTYDNIQDAVFDVVFNDVQYLYVHEELPDGTLRQFKVVDVGGVNVYTILKSDFGMNSTVRFHYMGYTQAVSLE